MKGLPAKVGIKKFRPKAAPIDPEAKKSSVDDRESRNGPNDNEPVDGVRQAGIAAGTKGEITSESRVSDKEGRPVEESRPGHNSESKTDKIEPKSAQDGPASPARKSPSTEVIQCTSPPEDREQQPARPTRGTGNRRRERRPSPSMWDIPDWVRPEMYNSPSSQSGAEPDKADGKEYVDVVKGSDKAEAEEDADGKPPVKPAKKRPGKKRPGAPVTNEPVGFPETPAGGDEDKPLVDPGKKEPLPPADNRAVMPATPCTKEQPEAWPFCWYKQDKFRVGSLQVMIFPVKTPCAVPGSGGWHPTKFHNVCSKMYWVWRRRGTPAQKCTNPKCIKPNGHSAVDCGYGQWRAHPNNPPIPGELKEFALPWPRVWMKPFPLHYLDPRNHPIPQFARAPPLPPQFPDGIQGWLHNGYEYGDMVKILTRDPARATIEAIKDGIKPAVPMTPDVEAAAFGKIRGSADSPPPPTPEWAALADWRKCVPAPA